MAKFTPLAVVNYPDLNVVYTNYSTASTKAANIKVLQNIKTKFLPFIERWGKLLEIDNSVIIGFIAVESMGKENLGPNNALATGLCQVTPVAVIETVSKFKIITKQSLPVDIVNYINSKAPYLTKLTPNNQTLSASNKTALLKLLKENNEFNILMGAISLRWLFDFLKFDGKAHLNRAIIGYNQSAYGRISKYKGKAVTTKELYSDKIIPAETRQYLAKLLGVDGFTQLILENKIY